MFWHQLTDLSQLNQIKKDSEEQSGNIRAVFIFKHSTRCSISSMALSRFESKWPESETIPCYFLDLLQYRNISDAIAEDFGVEHQSPQLLVIKNGKCIYHQSHNGITVDEALQATK